MIALPNTAGLGLKPEHFRQALECPEDGMWFEVHPENYMADGGPRLNWLDAFAEKFPISLHGVGMSLGGVEAPDPQHLARWKQLIARYKPAAVSEHLAWTSHQGTHFNDLLPVPATRTALARFIEHVNIMQDTLDRQVLIENPSVYIALKSEMSEIDFLRETVRRTGCGLLLDVNNVHVSCHNLGLDPIAYLDDFPHAAVGEIHIAGHATDTVLGDELLIDTHGAPIDETVWSLLDYALALTGPRPVLIERDTNIPAFEALQADHARVQSYIDAAPVRETAHVG